MQRHRNQRDSRSLHGRAAQAAWFHRRRLAAAAGLLLVAAMFVFAAPWLLGLALVEHHRTGRKRRLLGLVALAALGRAVFWLWREIWRHPLEPRGPWHPCQQCGFSIPNCSRARFCTPLCRRLARLQGRVDAGDERAAWRLAALTRDDRGDAAFGEVPF
jgi:hypothetical protein